MLCFVTLLMFGLVGLNLASGALPEGLVFLMNFDEGKGDTVHDLSGFGNDGIVEGKTDWVNGKYGKAFNFDGATNITVENAKPLSELTHPMSAGLWINPTAVGGWRSILEMDGPAGWKIGLHNGTDAIVWTTYHVKDFISQTPIEAGTWSHVATTWDGSQATVYVNGEPDDPIAGGGVIDVSGEPSLDIGWRSTSAASFYAGVMDDLFIYNKALDQQEIENLMGGLSATAVEPGGKAATTWGALRR